MQFKFKNLIKMFQDFVVVVVCVIFGKKVLLLKGFKKKGCILNIKNIYV